MQTMVPPPWPQLDYTPEDWVLTHDYQGYFQPPPQGMMGPMVPVGEPRSVALLQVNEGRTKRLGREQWPFLEERYAREPKPSTKTKQSFADMLGVDIAKINNWFQNRRAKTKQEEKKRRNQELMGIQILEEEHEEHEDFKEFDTATMQQQQNQEQDRSLPYRPGPALHSAPSTSSEMLSAISTVVQPSMPTSVPLAQPFFACAPYSHSTEDFKPLDLRNNLGELHNAPVQASGISIDLSSIPYTSAPEFPQHEPTASIQTTGNGIELSSSAYTSAPQYSQHEAIAPVQATGTTIDMLPNTYITTQPFSPREAATFQQSVPSSATHSPGEWSNYNAISSPTNDYSSDTTLPSETGIHAHDIFGSPSAGPWTFNDYSVQNSPAVATFAENALGAPAGRMMPLQSSFLSPPMSREMNTSTVSLSALDSYQMPPPDNATILKPRQNSQPSLAERRRKAVPSTLRVGPGSNVRTAGMMPMTPRSPSYVDQTLRKVKSNCNGAGRIQKPSTPGLASPSVGSFAHFQLDNSTPPPSAPPMDQKFSLVPNLEYPAPIRPLPVNTAQFGGLTWNPGPMSAPPTQHTFAASLDERNSPGNISRTPPSPMS